MATRLERINKQLQQLEEQKKVLLARERERERKADTRRKILIGAGLIEYARKDSMAGGILSIVIQGLREGGRNRELFDGWQPYPDWQPAVCAGVPPLGAAEDQGPPVDPS